MNDTELNQDAKKIYLKDLNDFFYGPNFWQAGIYPQLKDLSFQQALWKFSEERHSIWEIVRHMTFWKKFSIEYIKGNPIKDAREFNWTKVPEPSDESAWREAVDELKKTHDEFYQLAATSDSIWFTPENEKSIYYRQVIYHDCYHNGQIGLLRAMQGIKAIE